MKMTLRALTISLLLSPTMALAQQISVSPDRVFELKIKVSDVNKISNALGKLPYEDVAELIGSLRQQIYEQAQPTDKKPVEKEPEK